MRAQYRRLALAYVAMLAGLVVVWFTGSGLIVLATYSESNSQSGKLGTLLFAVLVTAIFVAMTVRFARRCRDARANDGR